MNKPTPERVEEFKKLVGYPRNAAPIDWLTTALTETDQQARASELELLAVHLDRQLAGYTNVSVDSVYRYIEQRKETLSNPPSQV